MGIGRKAKELPTTNKPEETKFKQQNLPAWQPILTASTVLPAFLGIGVCFIAVGVFLFDASSGTIEIDVDYTTCPQVLLGVVQSTTCAEFFTNINNTGSTCNCEITKEIEKMDKPVYMYYALTNFYQNHRRYVRSRDDNQLHGDSVSPGSLNEDCDPYKTTTNNGVTSGYAPCGAIANSLFNDTYTVSYTDGASTSNVGLLKTGIAWVSDKNVKFNNPSSWADFQKPPNWQTNVWDLDADPENNGYQNEDLIVWMRTAALPSFRKLHRRIDHTGTFENGLPAGTYTFVIKYNYPVIAFEGTKKIILATTTWLGGKNNFLGIAYTVVGSLCLLLFIIFIIIHFKWGKRLKKSGETVEDLMLGSLTKSFGVIDDRGSKEGRKSLDRYIERVGLAEEGRLAPMSNTSLSSMSKSLSNAPSEASTKKSSKTNLSQEEMNLNQLLCSTHHNCIVLVSHSAVTQQDNLSTV